VKSVVAQLKDKGVVTRGWIGVQIQPVTPEIAESLGLKKPLGALVAEPQQGSPAAKAGIEAGEDGMIVGALTVLDDLEKDPRLKTNGMRVKERAWLLPRLAEVFRKETQQGLAAKLEAIGLPFAPIAKPWDLLDDPHLQASGGLLETRAGGKTLHVPALPVALDGRRLGKRADPPEVGQHARELLTGLGCSPLEIQALADKRIVALPRNSGSEPE